MHGRPPPVSEQQLIDEVRYLHALWRQGPPPPRPGQPRRPPTPPTPNQWPADPPPPLEPSAPITWETTKTHAAKTVTAEEQERACAAQTQKEAVQFCRDHFADGDEDGDDMEEVDDEEDEEEEMEDGFFSFFKSMFEKEDDLAEVYRKGWADGEFVCLVCAGTGARVWKKFPNLVALVQHSLTISNTKRRFAHRAFGRAVCQVLEWDANRLPNINPPVDDKKVEDDGGEEDGEEDDEYEDTVEFEI